MEVLSAVLTSHPTAGQGQQDFKNWLNLLREMKSQWPKETLRLDARKNLVPESCWELVDDQKTWACFSSNYLAT